MGGVSEGSLHLIEIDGRSAARLTGTVSLDNNGGFVQMGFDLSPDGRAYDASDWDGVAFDLRGNGEVYDIRLRTDELTRPWQSYRVQVIAPTKWTTIALRFEDFTAHRTDIPFDPARLRRIGVLGIGRAFEADVAVAAVRLLKRGA